MAHIAPAGRGQVCLHIGIGQRFLHLGDCHIHKARIAVGAAPLIGDPEGPHIALFKNMNAQAAPLGFFYSGCMDRAGVPIKDNIGYALLFDQINEGLRPLV